MTHEQFSRRRFLALMGGLACAQMLPGCTPKSQPLAIAVHLWPGYEPLALARSMGWLDPKQVTLYETKSATDSIRLLEEGKVDGAGLTLDEVLRIREHGLPVSVLLVCDISAGADMLLAKPHLQTLADIKGKRIGVEDGALGALMLYEVLKAAKMKLEDIKPVPLKTDQQIDAWQRGEIDAAITYEPGAGKIKKLGGKTLFDSRQIPELIFDVIAVRTALLDDAHADALYQLVAAHLKGLRHLNSNPDDAAYRMSPRFGLPPDQVMSTFKGLVLPDLANNIRLLDTASPVLLSSSRYVAEAMFKAGILHKKADMNSLLRPEFLLRAA